MKIVSVSLSNFRIFGRSAKRILQPHIFCWQMMGGDGVVDNIGESYYID